MLYISYGSGVVEVEMRPADDDDRTGCPEG